MISLSFPPCGIFALFLLRFLSLLLQLASHARPTLLSHLTRSTHFSLQDSQEPNPGKGSDLKAPAAVGGLVLILYMLAAAMQGFPCHLFAGTWV